MATRSRFCPACPSFQRIAHTVIHQGSKGRKQLLPQSRGALLPRLRDVVARLPCPARRGRCALPPAQLTDSCSALLRPSSRAARRGWWSRCACCSRGSTSCNRLSWRHGTGRGTGRRRLAVDARPRQVSWVPQQLPATPAGAAAKREARCRAHAYQQRPRLPQCRYKRPTCGTDVAGGTCTFRGSPLAPHLWRLSMRLLVAVLVPM